MITVDKIDLGTSGDEWTCLCGNTADSDGFYAWMPEPSREVEPTPAQWTSNAYVCFACLRVFDVSTGTVTAHPEHVVTTDGVTLSR